MKKRIVHLLRLPTWVVNVWKQLQKLARHDFNTNVFILLKNYLQDMFGKYHIICSITAKEFLNTDQLWLRITDYNRLWHCCPNIPYELRQRQIISGEMSHFDACHSDTKHRTPNTDDTVSLYINCIYQDLFASTVTAVKQPAAFDRNICGRNARLPSQCCSQSHSCRHRAI